MDQMSTWTAVSMATAPVLSSLCLRILVSGPSKQTKFKPARLCEGLCRIKLIINVYFQSSHRTVYLYEHYSSVFPPDCDLHMLSASPVEQKEHKEEEEKTHPNKSVSHLQCRPVSPSSGCLFLKLWFNYHLRHRLTRPLLHCQPPPSLTTTTKRPSLWILDPPLSTSPPTWTVLYTQTHFCTLVSYLNEWDYKMFAFPLLQLPETLLKTPTMKMQTITIPSPGLTGRPKTPVRQRSFWLYTEYMNKKKKTFL